MATMGMSVGKILATVGTGIIKQVFPAAGAVIDVINTFLPADKKLPADATGEQATAAINSLPAEVQASIMSKEIDLEIEKVRGHTEIVKALADADISGNSTRPRIALMMAWMLVGLLTAFALPWAYAVCLDKSVVLEKIAESWSIYLVVLGIPMEIIRRYFGARTEDKKTRAGAALGQAPALGGIGGLISSMIKR